MATGSRPRTDSPPIKSYHRGGDFDHQMSRHSRKSVEKSFGEDDIEDESISDDGKSISDDGIS